MCYSTKRGCASCIAPKAKSQWAVQLYNLHYIRSALFNSPCFVRCSMRACFLIHNTLVRLPQVKTIIALFFIITPLTVKIKSTRAYRSSSHTFFTILCHPLLLYQLILSVVLQLSSSNRWSLMQEKKSINLFSFFYQKKSFFNRGRSTAFSSSRRE